MSKDKLSQKRAKLAKDRFKINQEKLHGHLKSKTEQTLLKKIRDKNPPFKVKINEVDAFADIWASPAEPSKKLHEFKQFTNKTLNKVKAVVNPLPG